MIRLLSLTCPGCNCTELHKGSPQFAFPPSGTSGWYLADSESRAERRFARNQVQISSRASPLPPSHIHSPILNAQWHFFSKMEPATTPLVFFVSSSSPFSLPRLPILHGWNFKAGLKWKRRQAGFGKRQLDFKCPLLPSSSCLWIAFHPLWLHMSHGGHTS